jgi:membrane-associated protease RseP (regulator of RpoE activity)
MARLIPWLALATFCTLCASGYYFWDAPAPGAMADSTSVLSRLWGALVIGSRYGLSAFAILLAHEMGHYVACRRYRVPSTLPIFLPGVPPIGTFGAVIRIRGPIPHRRALFDIAVAGPLAGFLVALPVLAYGVHRSEVIAADTVEGGLALGEPLLLRLLHGWHGGSEQILANGWLAAGWIGLLFTALNLFPVGQLDGGHVMYAISPRLHRWSSRLTIVLMLSLIAYQVLVEKRFPSYVLWVAILIWMRDRHPRLIYPGRSLGSVRIMIAVLLVAVFALSFTTLPFYFVE